MAGSTSQMLASSPPVRVWTEVNDHPAVLAMACVQQIESSAIADFLDRKFRKAEFKPYFMNFFREGHI